MSRFALVILLACGFAPVSAKAERPSMGVAPSRTIEKKASPTAEPKTSVIERKVDGPGFNPDPPPPAPGPGGVLERHTVQPGRGGLAVIPTDFSVELSRPAHARDPVRVTARRAGVSTFAPGILKLRITLTCDATKIVEIKPSVYQWPQAIFPPHSEERVKTLDVLPDDGEEWRNPPDCFYTVTATIDPGNLVPEPNEHDNRKTLQYAAPE